MNSWLEIPEDYDIEDDAPIHGELLLGWHDWEGKWRCEVSPYSTGKRVGRTSSVSFHGQATHYMYLPMPPGHENAKSQNDSKQTKPRGIEITEPGPTQPSHSRRSQTD